jgi:hypothetical protein
VSTRNTTPSAAQLREDAETQRRHARECRTWEDGGSAALAERAANALDAEAARLEREASATPHAELRGWGMMRPDGTLMDSFNAVGPELSRHGYRAVPVRLTTEGAE